MAQLTEGLPMSWAVLFRVREYLKGSLWYGPVAGPILGPLLAVLTHQADTSLTVPRRGPATHRPQSLFRALYRPRR